MKVERIVGMVMVSNIFIVVFKEDLLRWEKMGNAAAINYFSSGLNIIETLIKIEYCFTSMNFDIHRLCNAIN